MSDRPRQEPRQLREWHGQLVSYAFLKVLAGIGDGAALKAVARTDVFRALYLPWDGRLVVG